MRRAALVGAKGEWVPWQIIVGISDLQAEAESRRAGGLGWKVLGVCKTAAFLEGPGPGSLAVSVTMKTLGSGVTQLRLNLPLTNCVISSKLCKNSGLRFLLL